MRAITGAFCGMTARTGVTQPKLHIAILPVAPFSPQLFECSDALIWQFGDILTAVSPACTADKFIPKAKNMPRKNMSARR